MAILMRDEQLDAALDEVARELTAGEPHGSFKARVLARIDAVEPPRRRWNAAWMLSPLAAAAALVFALVVFRSGPRPDTQRLNPPAPETASAGTATPGRFATATAVPDAQLAPPSVARPRARALREPSEIFALAPPPLTIDSLDVPAIHTDSIALQRLDPVAPIGVTPLGIPSEGDRP